MKTNTLVFLDAIMVPMLSPFILIIFLPLQFLIQHILLINHKKRLLLVKFMGAGNLIAISNKINFSDVSIITSSINQTAAFYFFNKPKLLLISTNSVFAVIISIINIFLQLLVNKFDITINLESESKLAKLITYCVNAKQKNGISNTYRSILDLITYTSYFVPSINQRIDIFDFFNNDQLLFRSNRNMEQLYFEAQNTFKNQIFFKNKKLVISLYPSCSESEKLRRLPLYLWEELIKSILDSIDGEIRIIFPAGSDRQKQSFLVNRNLVSPRISILETQYDEFIDSIKSSDAIFSIDSSAFHIAQNFKVPSFVFFGPTSAFSIGLSPYCYPISLSLMCSPCIYKYFQAPCKGLAPCMNYSIDILKVKVRDAILYLQLKKTIELN